MIGSNDSRAAYWNKEQFIKEYRDFVKCYIKLPSQPDVFIVAPPHVPTSRFGLNNEVIRDEIQQIVEDVAAELGVHFINLYPVTEGHPEYYSDGLHLTPLGNRVIAKAIFSALRE